MVDNADKVKARLRERIAAIESQGARADAPSHTTSSKGSHTSFMQECADDTSLSGEDVSSVNEAERAFRKIERVACAREQASVALRRRLLHEGFAEDAVEAAIERALACGLVDDQRYADVLVRSRLSQGKGRRGIIAELEDLAINPDEVRSFTESEGAGDEGSEVDRALALLDRKPPRSKNLREAAYRRLMQKGYGSSVASSAARQWYEAQLT